MKGLGQSLVHNRGTHLLTITLRKDQLEHLFLSFVSFLDICQFAQVLARGGVGEKGPFILFSSSVLLHGSSVLKPANLHNKPG